MNRKFKNICVVGLGYIGLPTASLLANRGYSVLGVDILPQVVESINKGQLTIAEPGLATFLESAINSGKLRASTQPAEADVFVIAVPTPLSDDKKPDLSYVDSALQSILPFIRDNDLILLESTSPVGTTLNLFDKIIKERQDLNNINLAYCPERVLPGQTMKELIENDRIVGGINEKSSTLGKEFYSSFVQGEILLTDSKTAEMAKLVENAYRDVNLAFANEISVISESSGIDVWELIKLANRHPRVNILNPGSGVGGHCIAIDPWFIVANDEINSRLIATARNTNDNKPYWVLEKVNEEVIRFRSESGRDPLVACMGITYKPDIDDLRESPSLKIAEDLSSVHNEVIVVEPNLSEYKDLNFVDLEEAIVNADIIIYLVPHSEFKNLKLAPEKIVMDICGVTK